MAVLVEGPLAWIAAGAVTADGQVEDLARAAAAAREAAERTPGRAEVLRRLAAAKAANGAFFARVRDALAAVGPPEELIRAARRAGAADPQVARNVLGYLIRDWSALPEAEGEVAALGAEVGRGLDACGAGAGTAVVLGAGGGRVASELCGRFAAVEAVDRSALTAAAVGLLRAGAELHETSERNARSADAIARRLEVRARPAPGLRYTVADALELPFGDGTADAVVSVFFTDVVPLAPLLAEVRRVLAPGGAFVHLGPLGYPFEAIADMLAADEVAAAVGAAGFEVRREASVPLLHCASAARIAASRFECLSLAAVRRPDEAPAIDGATILVLAGPLRVATERLVTEAEERAISSLATLPSGRRIELGDVALALVEAVDGEAPLSVLLGRLEAEHGVLGTRAELETMASRLVRQGVLAVRNHRRAK